MYTQANALVRSNRHLCPPKQTSSSTPTGIIIHPGRHLYQFRQASSSTPTDIIVHPDRHHCPFKQTFHKRQCALWVPREPCISHACVAPEGTVTIWCGTPGLSADACHAPRAACLTLSKAPRSGVSPYWRVCAPDGQGLSCAYACSWE